MGQETDKAAASTNLLVELVDNPIDVGFLYEWVLMPSCGAVVVFSGTARDHSEGRPGVSKLEYEAYEEQALPRMERIGEAIRAKWPSVGKIAMVHRTGEVPVTQTAVVVAVSGPHRPEAFDAARFAIDSLKATVPIWKNETWKGGKSWGGDARPITDLD